MDMDSIYSKTALYATFFLSVVAFGCSRAQQGYESSKDEYRTEVSQYGITWTFDKPVKAGRFITGDWWVVGPVKIVKVTPAPGPGTSPEYAFRLSNYNDTSLREDTTMRNGSMVVLRAGTKQGYDSRSIDYRESESVSFPLVLPADRSLVSSISNPSLPVRKFVSDLMWAEETMSDNVLRTAAVLTCLKEVPPANAFRPPYAGTVKPIFNTDMIQWGRLPSLTPAGEVPSWTQFERYLQRPWIDHIMSWTQRRLAPSENGPDYGREYARVISIASLMVSLDVPRQTKERLTLSLIQKGIDLYGIAMAGGYWNEGGGHSSGRKWPILFAGMMLGEPLMAQLPETAIFQEDTQTYYGKGWFGQTALYWMIKHHGKRSHYEEKPPEMWEKWDSKTESYRNCCTSIAWVGTALTARYMKAIGLWRHDAFFDYVDRWMREDDPYAEARNGHPRPRREGDTMDPFVTAMWKAHRKNAPKQEMAGNPQMWVWGEGDSWTWEPNPKPE